MAKRITIKQMVKDIFFDATAGRRTADNFLEGQLVLSSLQYFYYRPYFERIYGEWLSGAKSARAIMSSVSSDLYERGPFNERAREVALAIDKVMYA